MNLLKSDSTHSTAAFGLPILLSAAILLAHGGSAGAADKMVGGEFATKGIVTSTVGPNDAKGQPASVLTFTDDEVKKLHDGHSAALLFQTSSDWANAVTRGAQDEFNARRRDCGPQQFELQRVGPGSCGSDDHGKEAVGDRHLPHQP